MAIRFEYGPPPSALGSLAYQAGAAEAADRRRREIEQMQMQAAQMRQQQQQNALNRQFDSWKTQYSHHSALDKMQRDYKWREEQAEVGRGHEKEMFGMKNERGDFEWDRQAEEMRERQEDAWEEQRRQNDLRHDHDIARQEHQAQLSGDQKTLDRLAQRKQIREERKYQGRTPEGKKLIDNINADIDAMKKNQTIKPPHLDDEEIGELAGLIKQKEAEKKKIYEDKRYELKNDKQPNTQYVKGGMLWANDPNGIPQPIGPDPDMTREQARKVLNLEEGKKYRRPPKDGGGEYTLELVYGWNERANRYMWSTKESDVEAVSPQQKLEDKRDRNKAFGAAYEKLFMKPDDTGLTPAGALTPMGAMFAREFGYPVGENNVLPREHHRSFMDKYMSNEGYPAPADDDQAALGGRPFSVENTGELEGIGGQPGLQGQAGIEGIAAKVNAGVKVNTQEAIMAEAQAQQQKVLDDRVSKEAKDMRGVFRGHRHQGYQPTQPLTPEGYGLNDPHIDEPERQRRQKAFSEALTRQGHERQRKGREDKPKHWPLPADVVRNPVPGVRYDTTPNPLAEPLEKYLGVQEASLQPATLPVSGLKALSKGARYVGKKAIETEKKASKATSKFMGTRGSRNVRERKQEESTRRETRKTMEKGTPGARIPIPKIPSAAAQKYVPVSRTRNKDEYEKFNKDLRGYTHRLLNNKDASKDAKIRLDRITTNLSKMSKTELADEIRVLKVLGRSANIKDPNFFDENPVWKDFVAGEKTTLDKLLGITMTPAGRPKWTGKDLKARAKYNPIVMKRMARELHESLKKAGF